MFLIAGLLLLAQVHPYQEFVRWRERQPKDLTWEDTLERYRRGLERDGGTDSDRTLSITILLYEDTVALSEWSDGKIRLVRLLARKKIT